MSWVLVGFIIALLFNILLAYLLHKSDEDKKKVREFSGKLIHGQVLQIHQLQREYKALDEGMYEQADAYEQQFLTFKEKIEELEVSNKVLRDMNAELEDEKAIKDKIIEKHAGHCDIILEHTVEALLEDIQGVQDE